MTLQRLVDFSAATAALLIGSVAMSQAQTPDGPPSTFTLKPLGPGVYAAIDSGKAGSNAGFIIGDDGVLVVDSFYDPDAAKEMLANIRKLTPLPIKYVVNTHYHIDHVNGNSVFKEAGATIIAQRNVRDWIHTENLKFYGSKMTSEQKASVEAITSPELLVDRDITIYLGGRRLEVRYFPGHTGGDLVVGVPDARVLFCGDLLWRHMSPNLIDGSIGQWIATDEAFEHVPHAASTTFVPGHGDVANVGDVADFAGYLKALRGAVTAAMKSEVKDKALVQTVKAKLSPHYREWLGNDDAVGTIGLMVAELEDKKPRPVPTLAPSVTR